MNNTELTSYLKENNYLLVDKNAFLDFMVEVNHKTKVDKRVLYLDRKTAAAKYNITRHWFQNAEKDRFSVLSVIRGKNSNSTKKYAEQSIIDELKRQSYI